MSTSLTSTLRSRKGKDPLQDQTEQLSLLLSDHTDEEEEEEEGNDTEANKGHGSPSHPATGAPGEEEVSLMADGAVRELMAIPSGLAGANAERHLTGGDNTTIANRRMQVVGIYRGFIRFVMMLHFFALVACLGLLLTFLIYNTNLPTSFVEIPMVQTSLTTIDTRIVHTLSSPYSLAWLMFAILILSSGYFLFHLVQLSLVNHTLTQRAGNQRIGRQEEMRMIGMLNLSTPSLFYVGTLIGFSCVYLGFVSALYSMGHLIPAMNIPAVATLMLCTLYGRKTTQQSREDDGFCHAVMNILYTLLVSSIAAALFLLTPIMSFTTKTGWVEGQIVANPALFSGWSSPPIIILILCILFIVFACGYLILGPHFIIFHICTTLLILALNGVLTAIVFTGIRDTDAFDTWRMLDKFLYGVA